MVKMTFDKYDELIEKFEAMPNPLHDYGITKLDMEKMEAEPEKYFEFVMYLSTRPWYKEKGDNTHVFINHDALKPEDAAFLFREFINNNIDPDDSEETDEDEIAAMKAMLGLK